MAKAEDGPSFCTAPLAEGVRGDPKSLGEFTTLKAKQLLASGTAIIQGALAVKWPERRARRWRLRHARPPIRWGDTRRSLGTVLTPGACEATHRPTSSPRRYYGLHAG